MDFLNTTGNPALDKEIELLRRRLLALETAGASGATTDTGGGTTTPVPLESLLSVRAVGGAGFDTKVLEFDGADGFAVSSVDSGVTRISLTAGAFNMRWVPLTNGSPSAPELIFSAPGECVMILELVT